MKNFWKRFYLVIVLLFLYLPIITLIVLSFNNTKTMGVWKGFTLKWYQEMLSSPQILNAFCNTLFIALIAAVVSTIVGTIACVGIMALSRRQRNTILQLTNIPLLNADIVTAVSLLLAFGLFGISLSLGTVIFAHITFCLPYVILNVLPKLRQSGTSTYEAALDLGASPVYAFMHVVLPDIMPGVFSGFLLAFTMSLDDFIITYFTRGAGINTISTLVYSQVKVGIRPTIFALSTVIFVIVLVVLLLSNFLPDKIAQKREEDAKKGIELTPEQRRKKKTLQRIGYGLMAAVIAVVSIFGGRYVGAMTGNGEVIYFYNYGDYIDPDLVTAFEMQTGIKVVMDTFDTNESMYPIVEGGQVSYDVIVAGDYTVEKMIANKLLQPINYENIPNAVNLEPSYMEILARTDPGNTYMIPYTWGTVGILYNKTMIPEGRITSWKDLWDPELAEYGILMQDSLRDTFMVAEMILGFDMNTSDPEELQQVVDLLIEQQPLVQAYENDAARDDLITEDAGIGMIYSGEYLYCLDENENLDYVIPEEGTNVWFDCFVIPANAKNVEGAEKFINFMLDADAGLATFEYLTYPIPNSAAMELIDEEIREDENVFPSQETLDKCDMYHYLGKEADQVLASYWKRFRGN
ncbi:MAG: extracellular solute-binding protein [Lachnospiraceae bacterium]|nr:extracellular solute-binding protein [Lachnospiraceae bacterium]MBQ6195898.1 extracellular solute-binding protein [Lachnospiraceae bacterium]